MSSSKRVFLIHAVSIAIEPINEAFKRLWPEAQVSNLLEDSLSTDLAQAGQITEPLIRRFVELATYAQAAGADGILFTCSAFGEAIDACQRALSIPVLKPNEAMVEEALACGERIAIVATFEPAIRSISNEVIESAAAAGRTVEIQSHVCPEALDALRSGDVVGHDRMIRETVARAVNSDVVCFAQFSMTSAAAKAKQVINCALLTTPDSAVMKMRRVLGA